MISKRISLSRDFWAAGVATIGTSGVAIVFAPQNGSPPNTSPPALYAGDVVPNDAVPCIFADRIFLSCTSGCIVRPVIPGSPEATPYVYPKYQGALGGTGYDADWTAFSPSGFAAAPASAAAGITVPAGAIAFPIEVACIGLVVAGASGQSVIWAAYGSNKRA